ncbi:hypothetical protein BVRB_5g120880 [Beta vulgaris subsp. vulgaris]|nr:hypothetical protein BVRB_5g120880 [Beta vulgaris subsp. vulgaris]
MTDGSLGYVVYMVVEARNIVCTVVLVAARHVAMQILMFKTLHLYVYDKTLCWLVHRSSTVFRSLLVSCY